MKSFTINQNDAGQRISKFVEKTVPALPNNLLYKYFRLKRIKLNKKRCQPQDKLQAGDLVELYINDEFFGEGRQDLAFLKVPSSLNIIYEDENIMLVDKKPGLVVHEDDDNTPDTLINRILHYLYEKGEYDPEQENSFVPALCNRIDRNTGGIVIAAKNAQSLRILNQKVKDRELVKLYLCLVHGVPEPKSATLKDFLLKDSSRNQVRRLSAVNWKRAEPIKSALTWLSMDILWLAILNTEPMPKTKVLAIPIRLCTLTNCVLLSRLTVEFSLIWMVGNSA